jgi:hypothetical protein
MNRPQFEEETDREVEKPDAGTLALLARAEVDGQIATAHAFPRSFAKFTREARELATVGQDIAESCIYSLPRGKGDKKTTITGPSARFAEIIQYSFGNSRGGGRVVEVVGNFIVAQGVFHDLEKNVMTTMEVRRRITDSNGRKFNDDMITVTGNAAASIAHRNAVLKAVPKALWLPIYEAAREVAIGDLSTIEQRRKLCLAWFQHKGVTEDMILAKLEIDGIEDIGLDELEYLTGIKTGLRDGSLSVERAFGPEPTSNPAATGAGDPAALAAEIAARGKKTEPAPAAKAEAKPVDPTTGELSDLQRLVLRFQEAGNKDELDELCSDVSLLPKEDRKAAMAAYDENVGRLEESFGKL